MEGWEIIQNCELAPGTGLYGKRKFIAAIENLTPVEFNRFCKTYLHLMHFHSLNQGAWVTDETDLVAQHPGMFWQLAQIDFDAPVTFTRIE